MRKLYNLSLKSAATDNAVFNEEIIATWFPWTVSLIYSLKRLKHNFSDHISVSIFLVTTFYKKNLFYHTNDNKKW